MSKRANISPHDMVTQSEGYLDKARDDLSRVVGLQEVARKQKDVIRLNCVNDKLLQVKQLLNIGETAATNLQEAIARSDEDARYHEFSRVTISTQQVTVLSTEAEDCVGGGDVFLGPTTISVTAPDQPDNPTVQAQPGIPVVEPISFGTPFI